jgi:membrane-associated protein
MEILAATNMMDLFLHLDKTLETVIGQYHQWVYLLLFVIVFCETGFVATPFLPGDSLLFAAGSLAARPNTVLEVGWLYFLFNIAAICGDSSNYWIGWFVGPKIFYKENVRFLNKEYLNRTHQFYERHGGKTVAIARFMPIIRTFAPFVAGIGKMSYWRFLIYSVIGTTVWTCVFVLGGYFFGNISVVKEHFTIAIMAIIVISFIPGAIGFIHQRIKKND